jgi:hypothetical protein
MPHSEGDSVAWDWGNGTATGTVSKVYTQKTTVQIEGSEITRKASDDCPAYLITQDDGDDVLKSDSEVRAT